MMRKLDLSKGEIKFMEQLASCYECDADTFIEICYKEASGDNFQETVCEIMYDKKMYESSKISKELV